MKTHSYSAMRSSAKKSALEEVRPSENNVHNMSSVVLKLQQKELRSSADLRSYESGFYVDDVQSVNQRVARPSTTQFITPVICETAQNYLSEKMTSYNIRAIYQQVHEN